MGSSHCRGNSMRVDAKMPNCYDLARISLMCINFHRLQGPGRLSCCDLRLVYRRAVLSNRSLLGHAAGLPRKSGHPADFDVRLVPKSRRFLARWKIAISMTDLRLSDELSL